MSLDRASTITRWIAALRSGAYAQTRQVLRDGHGHCALGVLADLLAQDGLGRWGASHDRPGAYDFVDTAGCTIPGCLPEDLGQQLGLSIEAQNAISRMNDAGWDFAQIADRIEAAWDGKRLRASILTRLY